MKRTARRAFPLLAGCLWLVFLTLDLTRAADPTWIKFSAICLCCLFALFGAKTADGRLVAAALCLTVAADWFLLVLDTHYALGVALFLLVQALYAYRLYRLRNTRPCRWGLALRLLALLLFCGLAMRSYYTTCGAGLPLYMLLSLLYFANLCINTAEAFALGRPHRTFAAGLLLFLCCDLSVGAYNLNLLPGFTRVAMWLFYLPSQVLIVLSQEQGKRYPHEKNV